MNGFPELVASVQVGVGKAPPPAVPLEIEGPPERAALLGLGALGLMRRAGTKGTPQSPFPESPPETRRVAHASAALLEETLAAKGESVVLEWAAEATRRGMVAPPSVLPGLLDLAKRHPKTIPPILGERGRWLAGLMEIEFEVEPEIDGEAARAALRDGYDALDPKVRTAMVHALEGGLSIADEPILLRALKDRRGEIREKAAELLLRLPDSAPARELHALAKGLLRVERSFLSKSLVVEPPEPDALPKWLPRSTPYGKLGPKAMALVDVVRHVPPALWTGMPPAQLIERAMASDYALALRQSLQEAALRFDDQEWIDAFFERLVSQDEIVHGAVAARASESAFDRLMIDSFRRDHKKNAHALLARQSPFSPALSRAFVDSMRKSASMHYGARSLALRLDPSVLPLVQASWGEPDSPLEDLRKYWWWSLDLRHRLLQSLR